MIDYRSNVRPLFALLTLLSDRASNVIALNNIVCLIKKHLHLLYYCFATCNMPIVHIVVFIYLLLYRSGYRHHCWWHAAAVSKPFSYLCYLLTY